MKYNCVIKEIEDDEEVEPLPKMKNKAVKINPKLLNVITPPLIGFENKKIILFITM